MIAVRDPSWRSASLSRVMMKDDCKLSFFSQDPLQHLAESEGGSGSDPVPVLLKVSFKVVTSTKFEPHRRCVFIITESIALFCSKGFAELRAHLVTSAGSLHRRCQ